MYNVEFCKRKIRYLVTLGCAVFLSIAGNAAAQTAAVTLSWSAPVVDATHGAPTGYKIYYSSSASAPATFTTFADAAANLSYIFNNGGTALTPGNYWFAASAYNTAGESSYSSLVQGSVSNLFAITLPGNTATTTAGRVFNLKVFSGATLLSDTSPTANAAAQLKIPATIVLPASFDIKVKTQGFLTKSSTARNAASTAAVGFLYGGDVNGDDSVNLADYGLLKNNFGITGGNSDFNKDNQTNLVDYAILKNGWGQVHD